MHNQNPPENLTLIISSYGGDLHAAFALIDVMRGSRIPIHTVGLGIIASAALFTFIAGEPGHRIITPNTSILSHQYSMGSFGKEHELFASIKQADLLTKKLMSHYKKCTKLKDAVIREKLLPPQDVWLSAEDAIQYNLADEIRQLR
jgi:ATP-dependent Clp protease protease subunit